MLLLDAYKNRGYKFSRLTLLRNGDKLYVPASELEGFTGYVRQSLRKKMGALNIHPFIDDLPSKLQIYDFDEIVKLRKPLKKIFDSKAVLTYSKEDDSKKDESDLPLDEVSVEEAKRRNEIEKVKQAKLKNAQLLGEMILADEVDREMATQAALHIALLRNEESTFPNLLENKRREEIDSIVKDYHHTEIDRLGKLLKKRKLQKLSEPVLSDLIVGILDKLSAGQTISELMGKLEIEYDGDEMLEVKTKRYQHQKQSSGDV